MLAVALFPRPGEKLRPETTSFYRRLALVAFEMLPAAEIAHMPAQVATAMKEPIKAAEAIWKQRFYGKMRLAVIGEYIHAWCDFVCRDYANYARVALYEEGAFVGEPEENAPVSSPSVARLLHGPRLGH